MSLDQIIAGLLGLYAVALAIMITVQIIGASLYDIRAARQHRRRQSHPYAKPYRSKPLVAVIIVCQNHADRIESCLDSLRHSSYRKLQIVCVDNASIDGTKERVKSYLKQYPKLSGRLIARRRQGSWLDIIKPVQRYISGELVIIIDGSTYVDRYALRRLVEDYQDNPLTDAWLPKILPHKTADLKSLVSAYITLLSQRSHKAASLSGGLPTTSSIILKRKSTGVILGRKRTCLAYRYAAGVKFYNAATDRGPGLRLRTISRTGALGIIPKTTVISQYLVTLLTPVIISYFLYLAVWLREPLFLLLSMAGLALLLLFAIWEEEEFNFRRRLAYTIGIPLTYAWFYIRMWPRLILFFRDFRTFFAGLR